jgi:hypothetical protein
MEQPTLADDLLDGATAIAKFTGFKVRRVFYLCEQGELPAFKIGTRWCARKSELLTILRSERAS